MTLKDNKLVERTVVLFAVAALAATIGVGLSAQMAPRPLPPGPDDSEAWLDEPGPPEEFDMTGPPDWLDDQGMMGGPWAMQGPGRGMRGPGHDMRAQGRGMQGPGRRMGAPGRGMQGPGGARGPMGFVGAGLRELNLTDAQREKVRTILNNQRTAVRDVMDNLMDARRALHDAVASEKFDEAAVRAKAAAIGKIEGDLAVMHAKVRTEVLSVLTPEQQKKAQDLKTQREQRLKERRDRLEKRLERMKRETGGPEAV